MCFRVEQVRQEAELFIEELRMSGSFCRKESSSYLLAAWNSVWGQEGTWGRGAGGLTVALPVIVTWLWLDILSAAPHGGASHHPAVPLRMGTGADIWLLGCLTFLPFPSAWCLQAKPLSDSLPAAYRLLKVLTSFICCYLLSLALWE